jgi:hypothetical protein
MTLLMISLTIDCGHKRQRSCSSTRMAVEMGLAARVCSVGSRGTEDKRQAWLLLLMRWEILSDENNFHDTDSRRYLIC